MAQLPVSDNTALNAPKPLDDREGVFSAGVWRAYASFTEANAKTLNRRFKTMEVPITTEVSIGVFKDLTYRWNGTQWILSDAIKLSENVNLDTLPTPSNESFIIL